MDTDIQRNHPPSRESKKYDAADAKLFYYFMIPDEDIE